MGGEPWAPVRYSGLTGTGGPAPGTPLHESPNGSGGRENILFKVLASTAGKWLVAPRKVPRPDAIRMRHR